MNKKSLNILLIILCLFMVSGCGNKKVISNNELQQIEEKAPESTSKGETRIDTSKPVRLSDFLEDENN